MRAVGWRFDRHLVKPVEPQKLSALLAAVRPDAVVCSCKSASRG
jgi:hypothetical protein